MKLRHYLDIWVYVVSAFLIALFGWGYWYTSRNPMEPVRRAEEPVDIRTTLEWDQDGYVWVTTQASERTITQRFPTPERGSAFSPAST